MKAFVKRLRHRSPALVTALGIYLLIRATALLILQVWAGQRGVDVETILGRRYDAVWLTGIAAHGYDTAIPAADGGPRLSNLAFFPLYPGLIRIVSALPGVSPVAAGLLITALSSAVAAIGIYLVGVELRGHGTGVMLVALWAALPHAIVQQMLYTESLFTAIAAFCLLALLRRHWLTAGALCVLAGLTRATATALIVAVAVAVALDAWQRIRGSGWRWRASVRPLLALFLAPLGWLSYQAWVGRRLGRYDGWMHVQSLWGSTFDGGFWTVNTAARLLSEKSVALTLVVVLATLVVSAVCVAMLRAPGPVLMYTLVSFLLVIGTAGYFHSKARLLIPAFPLLLPMATLLADASRRNRWIVVGTATLVSGWFGGYVSLVWRWSP